MTTVLGNLKSELENFGQYNDQTATDRAAKMLNITRDTGEFLAVLVRATGARRVLEVGTSNGYSTLWLAEATRANGGLVTTIERSESKRTLAAANFDRSGLSDSIEMIAGNAGQLLSQQISASVDLLFLDSERSEYTGWWPDLKRVLVPGGLLVVDNALSHAQEMAPFSNLVSADPEFTTSLVGVGKGEFLATKARR